MSQSTRHRHMSRSRFKRGPIVVAVASALVVVSAAGAHAAPPEDTAPEETAPAEELTTVEELTPATDESAPVPEEPAEATADLAVELAPGQHTLFDFTGTQTASSYWQPNPNQPNYKSPNYAGGKVYVQVKVLEKPSSKSMQAQLCMWRHGTTKFQYETCAPANRITFQNEGTYYAELGAPQSWWKKAGGWDWSKPASVIRLMLKDPATGKLFLSSRCGAGCYRGGDLAEHVPVRFSGEVILVAQGRQLTPPADWKGCPAAWSPQC